MTFRVEIRPSGHCIESHPHESLLDSALAAGLAVDYGCSNGNCGKCQARLLEGELERLRYSDFAFPRGEVERGWFLMCCHGVRGDAVIDTGVARDNRDIAIQEIEVKVRKVAPLDERHTLLHVQTPRTRRLRFLAGQWARLSAQGDGCRLPIASCPCDDRNIQFHIANDPEACADATRLMALRPGTTLRLVGPEGDFVLDMESPRPRVMIGAAGGMAPLKSIVEHSLALAPDIPVNLLLLEGATRHYMRDLLRSWRDALDHFQFDVAPMAVISKAIRELVETPTRRPDAADYYVAGPEPVVEQAVGILTDLGVPEHRIRRSTV